VAAAVLIAHGNVDLVTADNCNNSTNCTNGGISVFLGNGDGIFLPPVSYNSGGQSAQAVVLVDVNGDGIPDAIVANDCNTNNCNSGEVSVLLGNGDGTFQSAVSYNSVGVNTISVAVADVNADGKPDIILGDQCNNSNNCSNGQVSVLLGNGDGTFQTAVGYGSGGQTTQSVAIADVNGDGKPDLEVANWCVNSNCSNGSVSILLGNGDGTFQTAVSYDTIGVSSSSVAVADVNGDGKPDLAVSNECNNNNNCTNGLVNILLGNGDGTFQAAVSYNSGGQDADAVALTDPNGDGKLDVVVANQVDSEGNYQDGGMASVLMGNGDGTFQTAVAYATGNQDGRGLAVADVNGDGSPDVVMASPCADNYSCNSGAVGVLLGNGNGTLQGGVNYSSGAWVSFAVTIADVNGDGN